MLKARLLAFDAILLDVAVTAQKSPFADARREAINPSSNSTHSSAATPSSSA